jgi:NADP-dependent 3-hydroxy acid dehydrogenase YdfG
MTERSSVVLVAGVSFGGGSDTRHALAEKGFDVLTPTWSESRQV